LLNKWKKLEPVSIIFLRGMCLPLGDVAGLEIDEEEVGAFVLLFLDGDQQLWKEQTIQKPLERRN